VIDLIVQKLKSRGASRNHNLNSLILQSLKAQRSPRPEFDVSRSIIYSLKQQFRPPYNYPAFPAETASLAQELQQDAIREPLLDVSQIVPSYNVIVNDESLQNPFIISSSLVEIIREHTNNYQSQEDKAKAIYDWMEDNIEYGRDGRYGYKNSKETLETKEGICGEMAFLYITMARCCSLRSSFVDVEVDFKGKRVEHGCAIVDAGYRDVLADPAYHQFDIQHRRFRVLSDREVLEMFNEWRG